MLSDILVCILFKRLKVRILLICFCLFPFRKYLQVLKPTELPHKLKSGFMKFAESHGKLQIFRGLRMKKGIWLSQHFEFEEPEIYFTLLMDKIYSVRAYDVHRVHPQMLLPCFSVSIATVLNQCGSATEWNNL